MSNGYVGKYSVRWYVSTEKETAALPYTEVIVEEECILA